jgi:hypothetical protein
MTRKTLMAFGAEEIRERIRQEVDARGGEEIRRWAEETLAEGTYTVEIVILPDGTGWEIRISQCRSGWYDQWGSFHVAPSLLEGIWSAAAKVARSWRREWVSTWGDAAWRVEEEVYRLAVDHLRTTLCVHPEYLGFVDPASKREAVAAARDRREFPLAVTYSGMAPAEDRISAMDFAEVWRAAEEDRRSVAAENTQLLGSLRRRRASCAVSFDLGRTQPGVEEVWQVSVHGWTADGAASLVAHRRVGPDGSVVAEVWDVTHAPSGRLAGSDFGSLPEALLYAVRFSAGAAAAGLELETMSVAQAEAARETLAMIRDAALGRCSLAELRRRLAEIR